MLYWQWLVLGLALVLLEIFLPSFIVIWFGIAALLTGLAAYWIESGTTQLLIFALFSALSFAVGWFGFLRHSRMKSQSGQGKDSILGEAGVVIVAENGDFTRGRVRFQIPILGAEVWEFVAEERLVPGDRVIITDIAGSKLKVSKA